MARHGLLYFEKSFHYIPPRPSRKCSYCQETLNGKHIPIGVNDDDDLVDVTTRGQLCNKIMITRVKNSTSEPRVASCTRTFWPPDRAVTIKVCVTPLTYSECTSNVLCERLKSGLRKPNRADRVCYSAVRINGKQSVFLCATQVWDKLNASPLMMSRSI